MTTITSTGAEPVTFVNFTRGFLARNPKINQNHKVFYACYIPVQFFPSRHFRGCFVAVLLSPAHRTGFPQKASNFQTIRWCLSRKVVTGRCLDQVSPSRETALFDGNFCLLHFRREHSTLLIFLVPPFTCV